MKLLYKISLLAVALIATQSFTMDSAAGKNNHNFAQFAYQHPFFSSLAGWTLYNGFKPKTLAQVPQEVVQSSAHQVLGLPTTAKKPDVKNAYDAKAKVYLEDANRGSKVAQEALRKLNEAYEAIVSGKVKLQYYAIPNSKPYFVDRLKQKLDSLNLNTFLKAPHSIKLLKISAIIAHTLAESVAKPCAKWVAAAVGIKYLAHSTLANTAQDHTHNGLLEKSLTCKKNESKI